MAPTKPSQSRELELGSFSQNNFQQSGPCPQSLPPALGVAMRAYWPNAANRRGGSTSPDAKSTCAINSAGRCRYAAPLSGPLQLSRSPDTTRNGGVALADVSISNRYGGTHGGWTSIVQPPFGAYATLGVREIGRYLLLVHHHRRRMERGWRSIVGWGRFSFRAQIWL